MQDNNALFDELLAAYRSADDPDRFLREFLLRLDDATSNAVVATERKLDRLDAARARLDAAREIPRPELSPEDDGDPEAEGDDQAQDDAPDDAPDEELAEAPTEAKKRVTKKPVSSTKKAVSGKKPVSSAKKAASSAKKPVSAKKPASAGS